jgi:hypothetical protein
MRTRVSSDRLYFLYGRVPVPLATAIEWGLARRQIAADANETAAVGAGRPDRRETSTQGGVVASALPPDGLRAADEVGADGRDRCFYVLSAIYAETGEDVQGVLPVCAGPLGLVQRVMGLGESIVIGTAMPLVATGLRTHVHHPDRRNAVVPGQQHQGPAR